MRGWATERAIRVAERRCADVAVRRCGAHRCGVAARLCGGAAMWRRIKVRSAETECIDGAVRRCGGEPTSRFISRNGNGGRHCCQPPLRRAKDLPVFVTWSSENPKAPMNPLSILAHQLRRRFPSSCSLFRGAWRFYLTAPPEGSLVFRSARPD